MATYNINNQEASEAYIVYNTKTGEVVTGGYKGPAGPKLYSKGGASRVAKSKSIPYGYRDTFDRYGSKRRKIGKNRLYYEPKSSIYTQADYDKEKAEYEAKRNEYIANNAWATARVTLNIVADPLKEALRKYISTHSAPPSDEAMETVLTDLMNIIRNTK